MMYPTFFHKKRIRLYVEYNFYARNRNDDPAAGIHWINSDLIGFTHKWRIYRNRHNVGWFLKVYYISASKIILRCVGFCRLCTFYVEHTYVQPKRALQELLHMDNMRVLIQGAYCPLRNLFSASPIYLVTLNSEEWKLVEIEEDWHRSCARTLTQIWAQRLKTYCIRSGSFLKKDLSAI